MIDIAFLASTTIAVLTPYLKKVGESIASETGKNLYSWIKGKFKSTDKEKALEELVQKPDDVRLQARAEMVLEDILKQEPGLAEELLQLVEKAKGDTIISIENSKNVNTGSINAGGDVNIGDKK